MQSREGDRGDGRRGTRRIDLDNLGRVLGRLTAASVVSFVLSLLGLVLIALSIPEEDPTFTASDPPVVALVGSWVGMWLFPLGYSVWSFWQLRRMERKSPPEDRNPLEKAYYLIALPLEEVDDPTEYERRLQLTLQSLALGLVLLVLFPYAVVMGE